MIINYVSNTTKYNYVNVKPWVGPLNFFLVTITCVHNIHKTFHHNNIVFSIKFEWPNRFFNKLFYNAINVKKHYPQWKNSKYFSCNYFLFFFYSFVYNNYYNISKILSWIRRLLNNTMALWIFWHELAYC